MMALILWYQESCQKALGLPTTAEITGWFGGKLAGHATNQYPDQQILLLPP